MLAGGWAVHNALPHTLPDDVARRSADPPGGGGGLRQGGGGEDVFRGEARPSQSLSSSACEKGEGILQRRTRARMVLQCCARCSSWPPSRVVCQSVCLPALGYSAGAAKLSRS